MVYNSRGNNGMSENEMDLKNNKLSSWWQYHLDKLVYLSKRPVAMNTAISISASPKNIRNLNSINARFLRWMINRHASEPQLTALPLSGAILTKNQRYTFTSSAWQELDLILFNRLSHRANTTPRPETSYPNFQYISDYRAARSGDAAKDTLLPFSKDTAISSPAHRLAHSLKKEPQTAMRRTPDNRQKSTAAANPVKRSPLRVHGTIAEYPLNQVIKTGVPEVTGDKSSLPVDKKEVSRSMPDPPLISAIVSPVSEQDSVVSRIQDSGEQESSHSKPVGHTASDISKREESQESVHPSRMTNPDKPTQTEVPFPLAIPSQPISFDTVSTIITPDTHPSADSNVIETGHHQPRENSSTAGSSIKDSLTPLHQEQGLIKTVPSPSPLANTILRKQQKIIPAVTKTSSATRESAWQSDILPVADLYQAAPLDQGLDVLPDTITSLHAPESERPRQLRPEVSHNKGPLPRDSSRLPDIVTSLPAPALERPQKVRPEVTRDVGPSYIRLTSSPVVQDAYRPPMVPQKPEGYVNKPLASRKISFVTESMIPPSPLVASVYQTVSQPLLHLPDLSTDRSTITQPQNHEPPRDFKNTSLGIAQNIRPATAPTSSPIQEPLLDKQPVVQVRPETDAGSISESRESTFSAPGKPGLSANLSDNPAGYPEPSFSGDRLNYIVSESGNIPPGSPVSEGYVTETLLTRQSPSTGESTIPLSPPVKGTYHLIDTSVPQSLASATPYQEKANGYGKLRPAGIIPALDMPLASLVQRPDNPDTFAQGHASPDRTDSMPPSLRAETHSVTEPSVIPISQVMSSSPSQGATSSGDGEPTPDLRELAREIYPLIRRMIMIEKERLPF